MAYKREQARISRLRLYPFTLFYSAYAIAVVAFALGMGGRAGATAGFFLAGLSLWTLIEYLFHRYVLHGRFPLGKGLLREFLHERLDPLHWEHHERPFDGSHVSGKLKDTLPVFLIGAPASLLTPIRALPTLLAGVVQGYVLEEWTHHSVHFYDFRNPYFRYMRRHHRYHHSPRGSTLGFGLSSGIWDAVFGTRYPEAVRSQLHGRRRIPKPVRSTKVPDAA